MNELWKIIQVILLSSVKFVAGPPFAYYNNKYDFTFFETVLYCVAGGMLGVLIFSYLSKPFFIAEHWIVVKCKELFGRKGAFTSPVADVNAPLEIHYEYLDKEARRRKVFTKRNRSIVKIWKKYGLAGIAIVTPVILSIPIGTIIANSLENNKKKILLYMFLSILFWTITMTSIFEILHVASVKDLQEQVTQ